MKNLILLFIVVLFSSKLLSQDIVYFFQNLPDEALFGVSKENRKKIVESGSGRLHEWPPFSDWVQIKDLSFWFRTNGEEGTFYCTGTLIAQTINYWKISNGNTLILIGHQGPAPSYFTMFYFYYFDGKDYKLLEETDVMPKEILINNFFKNNPEQNKERMLNDLHFLPREYFYKDGLNMVMSWGDNDKETLEKYGIIGNKMELIWNDGKFTKGKVYLSE